MADGDVTEAVAGSRFTGYRFTLILNP